MKSLLRIGIAVIAAATYLACSPVGTVEGRVGDMEGKIPIPAEPTHAEMYENRIVDGDDLLCSGDTHEAFVRRYGDQQNYAMQIMMVGEMMCPRGNDPLSLSCAEERAVGNGLGRIVSSEQLAAEYEECKNSGRE